MIERRRLVIGLPMAMLAGWQVRGSKASWDEPEPEDWVGRSFILNTGDEVVTSLGVTVWQFDNAYQADGKLEDLVAQAGTVDDGQEISVVSRDLLPLIHELPGRVLTWTHVAGAAAVRTDYVGGFFQREELVWSIIVLGTDTLAMGEFVLALAVDLIDREMTDPPTGDQRWTGGLWDLLPEEDELEGDFQIFRIVERGRTYGPDDEPIDD